MRLEDCKKLAELFIMNHFSGTISLGTGEPLMYEGLPSFVEAVLNGLPDVRFRILSNGMKFSKSLPSIFFSSRVLWGITLDGFHNAELHSLQDGVDVDTVKDNITGVCEAGFADHLYLNYTLNNQNVGSLKEYIDFAHRMGIPNLYVTRMKIYEGFKFLDKFRLSETDKERVDILRRYAEALPFRKIAFDSESNNSRKGRCLQSKCRVSPVIDMDCALAFCSGQEDRFLGCIFDVNTIRKWDAMYERLSVHPAMAEQWCARCFANSTAEGYFSVPLSLNPYLREISHEQ